MESFLSEYIDTLPDDKGSLILYKKKISVVKKLNPNSNIIKFNKNKNFTHVVKYVVPNKENTIQQINLIPITKKEFNTYINDYKNMKKQITKKIKKEENNNSNYKKLNQKFTKKIIKQKNLITK